MTRDVALSAHAVRDLQALDRPTRQRILDALQAYAETGDADVKKLHGRADQWRLRVGDWRVIFTLHAQSIDVARVIHRRNAYR